MKEAQWNLYIMGEHECQLVYDKYPEDLKLELRKEYKFTSCNQGPNSFLNRSYDEIVDMVKKVAKIMQKYTYNHAYEACQQTSS